MLHGGPVALRHHVPSWTAMLGLLLVAGCSGDTISRVEVSGKVTLDGQPLEIGSILFQPTAQGPSAGGSIDRGEFRIDRGSGPSPGLHHVEILSYQPTGRKIPDTDVPGKMTAEMRQIVPDIYNRTTQLEVEVTATGGNHFEFDLQR